MTDLNDFSNLNQPAAISGIWADSRDCGFTMASEPLTCSLLRTLAAAKPAARFLELGSGSGLSTAWLLDGMDAASQLVTVDNDETLLAILKRHLGADSRLTVACADGDETLLAILKRHLGADPRLTVACADGDDFLHSLHEQRFDFIFADTWAGKYRLLDEALALLNHGGLYVIDDMLLQPNWPEGHAAKVAQLLAILEQRKDLLVTKLSWASGVVLAAKR